MADPSQNFNAYWDQSINNADATCSWPTAYNYEIPLSGSSLNVHHIFMIIVGAAGVINICIATYLLIGHICNWTRPHEQKQYTRITLFIIVLSLTSFFSVLNYHTADQVEAVGQLYEGVAIVALFMLYLHILVPNEAIGAAMYQIESEGGAKEKRTWKLVFQVLPVRLIAFVAFEVLYGALCPMSEGRKRGRTIVTVIVAISTVVAILTIISFERRHKHRLAGHRPLFKLAAFKGVIVLQIVQNIVFTALSQGDKFKPKAPYHVSYNDWARGLPSVLFSWELVVASFIFLWAFAFGRFRAEIRGGAPKVSGAFGALLSTVNPLDIVQGILYSITGPRHGDRNVSHYAVKNDGFESQ